MKSVWAFPGQGSQRKGMGGELLDRYPQLVRQADEILGYSLRRLCLEDPDDVLGQTQFTQPALFAISALSFLEKRDAGEALPTTFAGHSLGEFSALFAAGAFDFETGIALVQKRGQLMANAPRGAMAAVIGLDQNRVAALLGASSFDAIDLANINDSGQIVISGDYDQIGACKSLFTDAGARYVRLNVSAAFHSRFMRDAEAEYAAFLSGFDLKQLKHEVIANRTARPYPQIGYHDLITQQMSHPVRWYESISWLLARGLDSFNEVGPGDVLSGLFVKIKKSPMPLSAEETISVKPKLVFMYSGQGTQYYAMGKELYNNNPVFRAAMDDCDAVYRAETGRMLIDELYDDARRHADLTDIMLSHPALYSIGYALTQVLLDAGVRPDVVLGHSLGEYVAATVSGAIAYDDALRMIVHQAGLLRTHAAGGGMLSVLAPIEHMERYPELYDGCILASVNFEGNFVLSGDANRLRELKHELDTRSVVSLLLPVEYGFQSPAMDALRDETQRYATVARTEPLTPPAYSSTSIGQVQRYDADHFWNVLRQPADFHKVVGDLNQRDVYRFIDLGPTGTLASFIKYGHGGSVAHMTAINQFGHDTITISKLLSDLAA